jgi:hypothetical protein
MNRRLSMAGVWCTAAFFLMWLTGYAAFAQWIPPLSPGLTAQETAAHYQDHSVMIRTGMIFMSLGCVLYLPWSVLLAQIIAQVERGTRILSWTQVAAGVLSTITFMVPAYLWATAAFRADRDPQVVQALSDFGWLLFITGIGPFIVQYASLGIAIFIDDRDTPAFPRWVGYLQIWVSLSFLPAVGAFFFKSGPLAWNGLFVWWIPLVTFSGWFAVLIVMVRRAVLNGYADGPRPTPVGAF